MLIEIFHDFTPEKPVAIVKIVEKLFTRKEPRFFFFTREVEFRKKVAEYTFFTDDEFICHHIREVFEKDQENKKGFFNQTDQVSVSLRLPPFPALSDQAIRQVLEFDLPCFRLHGKIVQS